MGLQQALDLWPDMTANKTWCNTALHCSLIFWGWKEAELLVSSPSSPFPYFWCFKPLLCCSATTRVKLWPRWKQSSDWCWGILCWLMGIAHFLIAACGMKTRSLFPKPPNNFLNLSLAKQHSPHIINSHIPPPSRGLRAIAQSFRTVQGCLSVIGNTQPLYVLQHFRNRRISSLRCV